MQHATDTDRNPEIERKPPYLQWRDVQSMIIISILWRKRQASRYYRTKALAVCHYGLSKGADYGVWS